MLKDFDFDKKDTTLSGTKRSELGSGLAALQRKLVNSDSSMLIIVDGWESSGKGHILKDLTRELDPRYFEVSVFDDAMDDNADHPFLWRFARDLPGKGRIAFFDRSFYSELMNDLKVKDERLEHHLGYISFLERMLVADNTIVLKLFLHHSEKTMEKRIEKLKEDPYRKFLITKDDEKQLKKYTKYLNHFDKIMEATNFEESPWHVISSEDLKDASREAISIASSTLKSHLDQTEKKPPVPIRSGLKEKPLAKVDLKAAITEEEYEAQLEKLQEEAGELVYEMWLKKIPCVLVFEGTDAAGKGGAISRLTRLIDPRSYDVATTAAPTENESRYNYLWRFYQTLPIKGKMTIYDRSWYGRVLVERVEGFTPEHRWAAAYEEINEMEHNLVDDGLLIIKFLIVIDKEEQKQRFKDRESDPEKIYKLTDEDWRNHEKFEQYEEAMNEMVARTDTKDSPWVIVEGTQKEYARIKVLKEFISRGRAFISSHEGNKQGK
jgi:polyphosphate:AMP phosphotransferase